MSCWPRCVPTTPPITASSPWHLGVITGPKRGAFGSACTCCNDHGPYLGAQRLSLGDWARVSTRPGPVVSQVIGPRRFFEWKPCDLCGGCHVRQAYQWNLLPVGTAEGDTAGLIWLEAFWTLGVAGVGGSTWSSGPGKAMWLGSATTSSLCLSNSITTMLQL